ncbi:hypothetical protein N9N67_06630 [Bacteriovoracaceae bacterium]|nr:hypothetical protein [Bacteriovoracaceae bacterium]
MINKIVFSLMILSMSIAQEYKAFTLIDGIESSDIEENTLAFNLRDENGFPLEKMARLECGRAEQSELMDREPTFIFDTYSKIISIDGVSKDMVNNVAMKAFETVDSRSHQIRSKKDCLALYNCFLRLKKEEKYFILPQSDSVEFILTKEEDVVIDLPLLCQ